MASGCCHFQAQPYGLLSWPHQTSPCLDIPSGTMSSVTRARLRTKTGCLTCMPLSARPQLNPSNLAPQAGNDGRNATRRRPSAMAAALLPALVGGRRRQIYLTGDLHPTTPLDIMRPRLNRRGALDTQPQKTTKLRSSPSDPPSVSTPSRSSWPSLPRHTV